MFINLFVIFYMMSLLVCFLVSCDMLMKLQQECFPAQRGLEASGLQILILWLSSWFWPIYLFQYFDKKRKEIIK